MSKDKALVTSVYPNAHCKEWADENGMQWYLDTMNPMHDVRVKTIGMGKTAKAAWAAAAMTIAMLASGCATQGKQIIYERVEHSKLQTICKSAAQRNLNNYTVYECTMWDSSYSCYVYVTDLFPENSAQEQCLIGHGVTHCFRQYFHKGPQHIDCTKATVKNY